MLKLLRILQFIGVLLLGYWIGSRPRYNYQEVAGTIIFTDSINNQYLVEVDGTVYTVSTTLPLPDSGKSIIIPITP